MRLGQHGVQAGPAAGFMEQPWSGNNANDRDQGSDDDIHVRDRGHAGKSGGNDDKHGDDPGAEVGRNLVREDEMQNIAAALELVAGDAHIGEEDSESAEDSSSLVVARLQQIGESELGELSRAGRDEVDEQQAQPAAGGQPEGREPIAVCVLRAGKQRSRADPRREQREHQDQGRQRTAGDEIVGLGFDARGAIDGHRQENGDDDRQDNHVKLRHAGRTSRIGDAVIGSSVSDQVRVWRSKPIVRTAIQAQPALPSKRCAPVDATGGDVNN